MRYLIINYLLIFYNLRVIVIFDNTIFVITEISYFIYPVIYDAQ